MLPNPYAVYIGLEAGAASIRNFEPIVVPGLLQTEEYARATFRNGPRELDQDEVERRVEVRMPGKRSWAAMIGHGYGRSLTKSSSAVPWEAPR